MFDVLLHSVTESHWRQRRRGCRGHVPPIFWLGGTSTGISPQYYYVLSGIPDHYWLPYVRSASSRFHSAIRRHQLASVRQADSRLTRLVPPNLELALTPLLKAVGKLYNFSGNSWNFFWRPKEWEACNGCLPSAPGLAQLG